MKNIKFKAEDYLKLEYLPITMQLVNMGKSEVMGEIYIASKDKKQIRVNLNTKTYEFTAVGDNYWTPMYVYCAIRVWLNDNYKLDMLGYGSMNGSKTVSSVVVDETSPNEKSPYGYDLVSVWVPLSVEKYLKCYNRHSDEAGLDNITRIIGKEIAVGKITIKKYRPVTL